MTKIDSILEKILVNLIIFLPVIFFFRSFLLNLAVMLIVLIYIILCFKKKNNLLEYDHNKILLLFFAYFFCSQFYTSNDPSSLFKSFALLRYFFLFNAIIFVISIIQIDEFKNKLKILLFLNILFILDIFFQYFMGHNILGFEPFMCDENGDACQRYSGFFGKEFIAGSYLSTISILIFILCKMFYTNKYINCFPLIILITIFITGERSAFLIALIFNIIFYALKIKFNVKNLALTIIILLIIGLSGKFLIKDQTKSRFTSDIVDYIYTDSNLTFLESIKTTSWGLHYTGSFIMISKKPFLGSGYKSFRKNCSDYEYINIRKSSRYTVCSTHPHNFHLEILVDAGIVGYFIFITSLVLMIRKYYPFVSLKKNKLNILIFIYFITMIFMPRPTGSLLSTFFATQFWFTAGSLIGYKNFITSNSLDRKLFF
ncbi:MAG: hypothetical protein CL556_10630 [Alphaproteobacteria bacterium]|nr:hypothetical protein [Alphaproteobacteria bacterium]|tara:strand:- start:2254 stop:3540 length:1287 start_codon:yes stop_codon:yes gene_type:complete